MLVAFCVYERTTQHVSSENQNLNRRPPWAVPFLVAVRLEQIDTYTPIRESSKR